MTHRHTKKSSDRSASKSEKKSQVFTKNKIQRLIFRQIIQAVYQAICKDTWSGNYAFAILLYSYFSCAREFHCNLAKDLPDRRAQNKPNNRANVIRCGCTWSIQESASVAQWIEFRYHRYHRSVLDGTFGSWVQYGIRLVWYRQMCSQQVIKDYLKVINGHLHNRWCQVVIRTKYSTRSVLINNSYSAGNTLFTSLVTYSDGSSVTFCVCPTPVMTFQYSVFRFARVSFNLVAVIVQCWTWLEQVPFQVRKTVKSITVCIMGHCMMTSSATYWYYRSLQMEQVLEVQDKAHIHIPKVANQLI